MVSANPAWESRTTPAAAAGGAAKVRARLGYVDALRGFVMVIMLLDHVRENFFLHMQVSDPVDAATVSPALFFTRLSSTLCAPVFIALTGLGAYLYGQNHSKAETAAFLIKRGLFLMIIDVTLMTTAWTVKLPPTIWLQVLWAIGICMIALAGFIYLPRKALLLIGLVIVCGHNLLDGIRFHPGDPLFVPWAMLHQRDFIPLPFGAVAKTSYPVLPWIGVILLGHSIGPWFGTGTAPELRQRRLLLLGLGLIVGFVLLRALNIYGDRPWFAAQTPLRSVISFLALTKYPPSLLFLMPTLGLGAVLLALFERWEGARWLELLTIFGAAPMFFYIVHIYVLRIIYHVAYFIWGPNHGAYYGVDTIAGVWAWYLVLIPLLYFPTAWYSRLKTRRRDIAWLKYL